MPRLPSVDNFNVNASVRPAVQFDSTITPQIGTLGLQQVQKAAEAIGQAGHQIVAQESHALDQAMTMRAQAAFNDLQAAAMDLTDGEAGYVKLKGGQIFNPDWGDSFEGKYLGDLKRKTSEIAQNLPEQAREKFLSKADPFALNFQQNLRNYGAKQTYIYEKDVHTQALDLAKRNALFSEDSQQLQQSLDQIKSIRLSLSQMDGLSGEAESKADQSDVLFNIIARHVQGNNPEQADQILKTYGKDLDPDHVLKANDIIKKSLGQKTAFSSVAIASNQFYKTANPSDSDLLYESILRAETNKKQFNALGEPMISPKGALGIGQLMPDTAKEVAIKNNIPYDKNRLRTDEAYNRDLGSRHFSDLVQEFKTAPLAIAAYNAGTGAVKNAMQKAEKNGGDWLSYLPKETQDYVPKVLDHFEKSKARRNIMSEQDFIQSARDSAKTDDPETLHMVENEAKRHYRDLKSQIDLQDQDNLAKAFDQFSKDGFVDPIFFQTLSPENKTKVSKYQTDVVNGKYIQTDWQKFNELMSKPDLLVTANLNALKADFNESEFKALETKKNDILKEDLSKVQSTSSLIASSLEKYGYQNARGNSGSDQKKRQEYGIGLSMINNAIRVEQQNLGRPLRQSEMEQVIADTLTPVKLTQKSWFGEDTTQDIRVIDAAKIDPKDIQKVIVPQATEQRLIFDFKQKYKTEPSDLDIKRAYLQAKTMGLLP